MSGFRSHRYKTDLMHLDSYRPLGRSGLFASPFALGTMTFGKPRWGTDEAASRTIFPDGVSRAGQLDDNFAELEPQLDPAHRAALDAASASEPRFLYTMFTPELRRNAIFGGATISKL